MDFPVVKFPPIPKPSYRGMNRSSSIPDQWILVDEEATRGERKRGRERERESRRPRVSSSRSISLESAAVPENCSTWMAVRCRWNDADKKGERKKKKRKEKKRKGKERGRKKKERKKEMRKRIGEMGKRERAVGVPISNWKLGLVPNRK